MDIQEFFKSHKTFTTSQATKLGFSKSEFKKHKSLVNLGAFPYPQKKGKRLESRWCYDDELASLVKQSKRINKQDPKKVKEIVSRIEEIVSDKLGFNTNHMEDSTNAKS